MTQKLNCGRAQLRTFYRKKESESDVLSRHHVTVLSWDFTLLRMRRVVPQVVITSEEGVKIDNRSKVKS